MNWHQKTVNMQMLNYWNIIVQSQCLLSKDIWVMCAVSQAWIFLFWVCPSCSPLPKHGVLLSWASVWHPRVSGLDKRTCTFTPTDCWPSKQLPLSAKNQYINISLYLSVNSDLLKQSALWTERWKCVFSMKCLCTWSCVTANSHELSQFDSEWISIQGKIFWHHLSWKTRAWKIILFHLIHSLYFENLQQKLDVNLSVLYFISFLFEDVRWRCFINIWFYINTGNHNKKNEMFWRIVFMIDHCTHFRVLRYSCSSL